MAGAGPVSMGAGRLRKRLTPSSSPPPAMCTAYSTVLGVFLRLARSVGLRGGPGQRGPRIHDLRHTFAVRSLERAATRNAVARHIVALSTYLGHAHVTDTYWYLQATPILMARIAAAGEACTGEVAMTALAPHLAAFLREHLPTERKAASTPSPLQ